MITIVFIGGPRDGSSRTYKTNPKVIDCHVEARKFGISGLYYVRGEGHRLIADWKDLPIERVRAFQIERRQAYFLARAARKLKKVIVH